MGRRRFHSPRERREAFKLTKAGAIVQMLQLALDEMKVAENDTDVARKNDRLRLAQRMVVDAKAAVMKLEVKA